MRLAPTYSKMDALGRNESSLSFPNMESAFPNMDVYLVSNECHAFALRLILPEQTANFFYPLEHWDRSVFYNIDLTSFPGFAFVSLSEQFSFGGNRKNTNEQRRKKERP